MVIVHRNEFFNTAPELGKKGLTDYIVSLLLLPVVVTLAEIIAHGLLFDSASSLIMIAGTMGGFMLISSVLSFFGDRINYYVGMLISLISGIYIIAMYIYYKCLHMFFTWEMIFMAGQVGQFEANIREGINQNIGQILLMLIPFVCYVLIGKKYMTSSTKSYKTTALGIIAAITLLILTFGMIAADAEAKEAADGMLYNSNAAYETYGFHGGTVININGINHRYGGDQSSYRGEGTIPGVAYNSLDIDFKALAKNEKNKTIKDMHEYFGSLTPSEKNEYTGMFKGKNLIFLTLEGFSYKCIDPEMTPTLYKMYNEGFKFENFYDTTWSGSTASGEYSNMTGHFYTSAACLRMSSKTYTYSALGNMFKSAGYKNYAYHNNNYQYYDRDLSHPKFGYKWIAVGNGLPPMENIWPRSDKELAEVTADQYMEGDSPWHAYYMTISGHAGYSFDGNKMSSRHKKDLPHKYDNYKSNVKAYLACNIEVDLMLEELIKKLEEHGELENTVFAMCCDHYPYALSHSELAELYGLKNKNVLENPELYRNVFILWSASMDEPVVVKKVCNSYDIAPTLYNLFGIDYESRIITGQDIMSSIEVPSIINNNEGTYWNWITRKGYYDASTGKFKANEDADFGTEGKKAYVARMKDKVNAMRKYSLAILDNDYYSYLEDQLNNN